MDIPSWRIAGVTVLAFAALSSNPHAIAMAPANLQAVVTASPVEQVTTYEVQPGDTLWKIAQRFQIDLDQLVAVNPAVRQRSLAPGTPLRIPEHTSVSAVTQPVVALQKQLALTRSGEPIQFGQVLSCKLTAYTAGPESTGKQPGDPGYGITFSGKQAEEGRTIAVDPQLIPIGSKVYIEGIGYRIAEDTGSAVKGEHIDIFMNDIPTAVQFGVQRGVTVYLLN